MSETQVEYINSDEYDGPWVGVAAFVDRLLTHDNGQFSLIGLIDRVTAPPPPAVQEGQPPRRNIDLTLFMLLRSGKAPAEGEIRVRRESPSGLRQTADPHRVEFPGQGMGVPIRVAVNLEYEEQGRYWFDIILDDIILTRIPLMIRFQERVPSMEHEVEE